MGSARGFRVRPIVVGEKLASRQRHSSATKFINSILKYPNGGEIVANLAGFMKRNNHRLSLPENDPTSRVSIQELHEIGLVGAKKPMRIWALEQARESFKGHSLNLPKRR